MMKIDRLRHFDKILGSILSILLASAVGRAQGNGPAKIEFSDLAFVHDLALGTSENDPVTFKNPAGVAVDKERRIYVADPTNKCIEVFASDGRHLETIGGKEGVLRLDGPASICFDDQDVLFIFEFTRSTRRIVAISLEKKILRSYPLRYPPAKILSVDDSILAGLAASDYNIQKFSKEGRLIAEMDLVSGQEEEKAATSFALDRGGNLHLARKFVPVIKRLAPDGRELSSFEYNPTIANRQPPIQLKSIPLGQRGNAGAFRIEGAKYPICYDIAVDSKGFQYLLVARDHAQSELCALWRIDPENKKIESAPLPFWCSRIHIDRFDQFYFFGSSDAPYVNRCRAERRRP